MKVKIKLYTEKNGYSIDITTWHNRLVKHKECASLMEAGDFLTDVFNADEGLGGIVDWFIEEGLKVDQNAEISAGDLYQEFCEWHMKKVGRKVMSVTMFGRIMGERFVKGKIEGRIVYMWLPHKERSHELA